MDGRGYTPLEPESDKHVRELENEIVEIKEKIAFHQRQIDEINVVCKQRLESVKAEQDSWIDRLCQKEQQFYEVSNGITKEDEVVKYLGPDYLVFVDGTVFMIAATLVIVTNIACMLLQMVNHDYAARFYWPNQFFMLFYIVEIGLKAVLFQRDLLCGPCAQSWWNWLDLIIVLGGVVDMYVKPALSALGVIRSGNSQISSILAFLRILRLARIMKVVKIFLRTDFAWTEGDHFQAFIMGVISFNVGMMGLQSDFPDFFLWPYLEQVLLIIFFFELSVRLKKQGKSFFHSGDVAWNWLDFVIVAGGVLDGWMMPCIEFTKLLLGMPPSEKGSLGSLVTMLRMVRILRMLRLVRLVKNIKPLFDLMTGIINAMQGMAWVLLLTALVLYIVALLCVRLMGHGLIFPGGAPAAAQSTFPDISTSMFVLFMAMNGDVGHLEDLMAVLPSFKWWVMGFMIVSSWAILSILTAVVSDHMIAASSAHHEEDGENERSEMRLRLEMLLEGVEKKEPGAFTKEEFESILTDESLSEELFETTKLGKDDLRQLFDYLSDTPEGYSQPILYHEDFFGGLATEHRTVCERSIMRLEKRINVLDREFHTFCGQILDTNKKILEKLN